MPQSALVKRSAFEGGGKELSDGTTIVRLPRIQNNNASKSEGKHVDEAHMGPSSDLLTLGMIGSSRTTKLRV